MIKVTRQSYVGDEPGSSKNRIELNSNNEIVRVDGYYKYDDKNNPFSMHKASGMWNSGSPLFQSKNNVVSWTEAETYTSGEDTWSATLQYEYNARDYPGKLIIEVDNDDECYSSETIEFNYKNCD